VVCSGTLTDGERPAIPGVQLAPKTPDLRALWTALRSAVPEVGSWPPRPRKLAAPSKTPGEIRSKGPQQPCLRSPQAGRKPTTTSPGWGRPELKASLPAAEALRAPLLFLGTRRFGLPEDLLVRA